jgi:hypothetical protein
MSGVQGSYAGVASLAVRRVLRAGGLFTAVIALLAVARPAAAHEAFCAELWNPHGKTTPPAGNTTLPGPNGGQNEDGFYQVGSCSVPGTVTCPSADNPIFKEPCFCPNEQQEEPVILSDGCGDGGGGTGFVYDGDPSTPCDQETLVGCDPFPFGTVIKFTEANGKDPAQELMAGSKQASSPAGDNSDSVEWHLWGQGDLLVTSSFDALAKFCCHVPPKPK